MRRNNIIKYTSIAWSLILALASCTDESNQDSRPSDAKSTPMTFDIRYLGQTRATETDFEKDDKIGLYVA